MKKNILLAFLFALLFSLHLSAQRHIAYEPLDKANPIDFRGDHIRYKGEGSH